MSNVGKYEWSENYLLHQGYKQKDIDKFFHINEELIFRVKNNLFKEIVKNGNRNQKCVFLLGQPGSGKSTYMKNNNFKDYIILDIDELRTGYPFKDELVKLIEDNHQKNKDLPKENSKGRDFTNFTRKYVGILMDILFEECVKCGYNITLQKVVSDYTVLEALFKQLKDNSYDVSIVLVLVDALTSWERCKQRNIINDMTLNTVAKDFHDTSVVKTPQTIVDIIDNYIVKNSYVSTLDIITDEEKLTINKYTKVNYDSIKQYIENKLNLKS